MFDINYFLSNVDSILDKLLPFFTLFLGWLLSQYSIEKKDRSIETRKINKLLFSLINLRQILYKDSKIEIVFKQIAEIIKKGHPSLKQKDIESFVEGIKPRIGEYIKNQFLNKQQIEDLENNIDKLILDISEVDPFFATVLSQKQNIKEKLSELKNYLIMLENKKNGLNYNDLTTYNIKPIIKEDFLKNVDDNILLISHKSDNKTRKEIYKLIKSPFIIDEKEISDYISELIRVKE
jgi:hypothetical protein